MLAVIHTKRYDMRVSGRKRTLLVNGLVTGGVVIPEAGARLPEGAEVRIQIIKGARRRNAAKIMRHAGVAKSLPPDASRNLEHYLYGSPKR